MSEEHKQRQQADHVFHVWINERQELRRKNGEQWEHDLYEFKSMLQFLEYGHRQIEEAFTGTLPTKHKQCSLSPVEPVPNNRLLCAMGVNVTECTILASLKYTFNEERNRECGVLGKYYEALTDEQMYRKMAAVCAWHMYTEQVRGKFMDTSEGWLTDETDRMYWSNVYQSLAAGDPDGDAEAAK